MGLPASKRFADFLGQKGRKVTKQMHHVVETASAQSATFSHDDVLTLMSGNASRATVFRTLARMVEAGMLRQVQFNDREVFVMTATDD